jgi:small conductance mechanosensitive channel
MIPRTPEFLLGQAGDDLLDACGEEPGWFCERVFEATGNDALAQAVDFLVARPLKVAVILIGAWLINRVIRRAIRRFVAGLQGEQVRRRVRTVKKKAGFGSLLQPTGQSPTTRTAQRAETIGTVLRSSTSAIIYGIASMMALAELGLSLGPLIAGAGIVGVALGFGAQSLVKDFLSGTFMLLEDQYGVGDVIDLGDASGVVEGITLRVTRLRDINGTVWHVPNGEIARVGNMSQNWARLVLDVGVAYEADVDQARDVILSTTEALAADPDWSARFLDAPELWGVEALGDNSVTIRVVAKVIPGEQWMMQRELRRRIKYALDEAGISIPFPQRTVWVHTDNT